MLLKMLGILLLASPFIGMTVMMVREDGWGIAFKVWGTTLAIVVLICGGVYLAMVA